MTVHGDGNIFFAQYLARGGCKKGNREYIEDSCRSPSQKSGFGGRKFVMKKSFLSVLLPAAMLFSAAAVADNDIDIPVNGDFRGMPSGYSPAPGWTLTAGGGSARCGESR